MTVLLWGLLRDAPLAAVHERLRARNDAFALIDQRRLDAIELDIELDARGRLDGSLVLDDRTLALSEVRAIYLRPHDWRRLPGYRGLESNDPRWLHAQKVEDLLGTIVETIDARVINRPSAMTSNGSKTGQLARIQALGFAVPETLVSNDVDEVRAFCERHGAVVYKSVSGVRSVVSCVDLERDAARLERLVWCPTQFQQWIPGVDHRVHVIGDRVFAAQIQSTGVDYRYASREGGTTRVRAAELPDEIAARAHALAHALELPVAGVDLRRQPDDTWVCFEVNPSPGFTYYQDACGHPIDEEIAELLVRG